MHTTYSELLLARRQSRGDVFQRFLKQGEAVERTTAQVFATAMQRGAQLRKLGLGHQERVALLVSDPADFLPLLYGCLLYGLVAVPFYPPPLVGRLETYHAALDAALTTANVRVAVVDDGSAKRWGSVFSGRTLLELSSLPDTQPEALPQVAPSDLALLQFTSGSTQAPRGVRISHQALMANIKAIAVHGLAATPEDHGVCWLPLYHDMGLVGFGLAALLTETPVTFIPTSRFIRNPNLWLQTLHEVRGTITFAPNFAYALATKRGGAQHLDLSSVRMWGCGAEPISERTLRDFEAHFASSGVKPNSVAPCYGLAEATLAVTFTDPRVGRRKATLETGNSATTRSSDEHSASRPTVTAVSCGKPLVGYDVTIVDVTGKLLPDGELGEVVVRGPSLGDGYEGNPEASVATFRNDGLHTGDRGYLHNGELFIVGRTKETIVLNGRNYDPHAFEQVLEVLPAVRRVAAVNVTRDDGDVLAIALERAPEPGSTDDALKALVRAALAAHFGVQAPYVVCVSPGSLPRTTSGKLQRAKVRLWLESSDLVS